MKLGNGTGLALTTVREVADTTTSWAFAKVKANNTKTATAKVTGFILWLPRWSVCVRDLCLAGECFVS